MSELKAGDLCLIVGCLKYPVDIGKTCELTEFVPPGQSYRRPDNGAIETNIADFGAWVVVGSGLHLYYRKSGRLVESGFTIINPKFLMPLGGYAEGQEELSGKELPA